MKAGILTYHNAKNYGAVLQAFALKTVIEQLGHECEVINYINPEFHNVFWKKQDYLKTITKTFSLKKRIKQLLQRKGLLSVPIWEREERFCDLFCRFAVKCLHITQLCTKECWGDIEAQYDRLIVGSDQVWNENIMLRDLSFFFESIQDPIKKNSYSASFGGAEVSESFQSVIAPLLQTFHKISLREKSGQELVEKLLSKSVSRTLDPVFLMTLADWKRFAISPRQKNYILFFPLYRSDALVSFVKKLSAKLRAKIVYVCAFEHPFPYGLNDITPTPLEFVGLFQKARCVVTNSFHGVAFSIVHNKDFYMEYPYNPLNNMNERFDSLIKTLGIGDRFIPTDPTDELAPMDYSRINSRLAAERQASLDYLKSIFDRELS